MRVANRPPLEPNRGGDQLQSSSDSLQSPLDSRQSSSDPAQPADARGKSPVNGAQSSDVWDPNFCGWNPNGGNLEPKFLWMGPNRRRFGVQILLDGAQTMDVWTPNDGRLGGGASRLGGFAAGSRAKRPPGSGYARR